MTQLKFIINEDAKQAVESEGFWYAINNYFGVDDVTEDEATAKELQRALDVLQTLEQCIYDMEFDEEDEE